MITRDNYEEFFLLYLDSELSASERQIVELFIAENPDLQEELESLQQCRISPDTHLLFEDKDSLLRKEEPSEGRIYHDNSRLNADNYEEYFLSFIDGELNDEARRAVADYTNHHPSRLRELMLLQHTVSAPDQSIVFANKEILYRKATDRKVLALPWLRVGAAAAIILAIGWFVFNAGQRRTASPLAQQTHPGKNDSGDVTTTPARTFNKVQTATAGSDNVTAGSENTAAAGNEEERGKKEELASGNKPRHNEMNEVNEMNKTSVRNDMNVRNEKSKKSEMKLINRTNGNNDQSQKNEVVLDPGITAMNTKQQSPVRIAGIQGREDSKIISPDQVTGIAPKDMDSPGNKDLAQNDRQAATGAGQGEISRQNSSFASQALLNSPNSPAQDDVATAESSSLKKNKLRGIFRRVSRVFEKTSNVDDEKQGILIGNFQVALK
jgi:anti-sigma factor RsiW